MTLSSSELSPRTAIRHMLTRIQENLLSLLSRSVALKQEKTFMFRSRIGAQAKWRDSSLWSRGTEAEFNERKKTQLRVLS